MSQKTVALIDGDIVGYRIAAMTHEESEWKIVKFELNYYVREVILNAIGATHYIGFFTGRDNFRKTLTKQFNDEVVKQTLEAKTQTRLYKGSRTDTRPYWWKDIQSYFVEYWGWVFVDGMEADDALAICQRKNSILCSNDHDFKQVPGYHFDFTKRPEERAVVYISPEDAYYNLWKQVITGCNTDEVEGIRNFGDVKAAKYLEAFSPVDYPEAVKELFIKMYGEFGQIRYDLTVQLITLRRGKEWMDIPPLRETPVDINERDRVIQPQEVEDEF